ncbi:MAG: O-antigen ligase family protein [Thermoanaerobaculia bacterium]|nr:O-antigen ligase family protein [Thermoanaerobaculia bacterium]
MRFPSLPAGAAGVLCILLAWAPLPFASVTPGGRLVLTLGSLLTMGLAVTSSRLIDAIRDFRWGLGSLGLLSIWGLLQSLSLPESWVAAVSPGSYRMSLDTAATLGEAPSSFHLSYSPQRSFDVALWLAALAVAGLAAAVVGGSRRRRRWLLAGLLAGGFFEALYGARRWTHHASEIWGVTVPGNGLRLRGTFVNSDHLAFYLAMTLSACFAWLWWALQKQAHLPTLDRRVATVAPPLLGWLALFACLAFTGSRAGLVAALTATVVQGFLVAWMRRRRRWVPAGIVLAALGLVTVATLGLRAGLGRWLTTSSYELTWNVRREVYAATWRLLKEAPWTGIGLGAFTARFPQVQPPSATGLWTHAHNDWLELLVSVGWPVALLFGVVLAAWVRQLLVCSGRCERSEDRAAILAALGAMTAAAIHSGLDFSVAMPANAFTLVVLGGAAAATLSSAHRETESVIEPIPFQERTTLSARDR